MPRGLAAALMRSPSREKTAAYSSPSARAADPVKVAPGTAVTVAATDADRGAVTGTLHGLDRDRIVVRRQADGIGPVAVHFPRHGFRLAPA